MTEDTPPRAFAPLSILLVLPSLSISFPNPLVTVPTPEVSVPTTFTTGPTAAANPAVFKIASCCSGDSLEKLSASFPIPSTPLVTIGRSLPPACIPAFFSLLISRLNFSKSVSFIFLYAFSVAPALFCISFKIWLYSFPSFFMMVSAALEASAEPNISDRDFPLFFAWS